MTAAERPIFAIASEYVDAIATLDPFAATEMGVAGHDGEVTDFSPAGHAARAALMRGTLARLAATPPGDRDEEIGRAVMRDSLEGDLERHAAGDEYYDVRSIAGPVQALHEVFDLMPHATAEDWQTIIRRLTGLPGGAATIEALCREGLRLGKLSSRRQVEETLRQLTSFAGRDPETPPAFAALPAALAESGVASPGLTADLDRAIVRGRGAFDALHGFLRDTCLSAASDREPAGAERYRRAARRFLGMTLDLEETYAWGWVEVERLAAEIRATAERIAPGAGVDAAVEALDADPARQIEGEAALVTWLQAVQDGAFAKLDGVYVDVPPPVRRIEACIAPPGGSLAQYYTAPSEDLARAGRIWYPTGGHTVFHRWRDTTMAYHEGVPGHHLQIALALHQAQRLTRFQRLAVWCAGHGEGWALYAERLMAELGFLADPGDYLGMLLGQMHRAVRVVVDIGLHAELPIPRSSHFEPGQPWTYARMLAFLMEQARLPEDLARSEVLRYLGWPGQAIAYKVGERAWLQIREESRARHGAAFSLREFHNRALALGSLGLDLLRETMRSEY